MIDVGKWELDDLVVVKKLRVQKALAAVKKAEQVLQEQKNILEKRKLILEKSRKDVVDQHNILIKEKFSGTTPNAVKARGFFIEKLEVISQKKQEDVISQKKNVQSAKKALDNATIKYREADKEVRKLEEFRKEWKKKREEFLLEQEEEELDEIGILMFENKKRKERKK